MKKLLSILSVLLFLPWTVHAANPSYQDFNTTQIGRSGTTAGSTIWVTNGVPLTNMVAKGTFSYPSGATNGFILITDANGLASWTTNVPALTVTNLYVINEFKIQGKTVNFTSVNGTNVQQLNLTNSATVTWAYDGGSNVTATGSASGGGVSTAVTALGLSGTNVTGFSCLTNNMTYTLTLTNHLLFGTSTFTDVPNTTTNHFFTLGLKQDASGGWVPKFTNSVVAWADGVQAVIKTNANALSYVYFHTHLFTNGMLVASPNINVQ